MDYFGFFYDTFAKKCASIFMFFRLGITKMCYFEDRVSAFMIFSN